MLNTSRFSPLRVGVQKKLLARRVEIGVVTLTLTLIVLTCVLSILLLLHSNKVATRGYELKSLFAEQHELKLINERLNAEVASRMALNKVKSSEFVQNTMVSVKELVILNTDAALVKK